ncbi:MAG: MoxR family ATPase [Gammaproteobacteria bacterium]|nr:MoxR family ATPase [Gammaproteobacteria bacterium]
MRITDFPCGKCEKLASLGSWPASGHYYAPEHIKAVVAAWHARRPLLVRGEPGVGKSQLASAVAQTLGWQFISITIQPRTEYQDLLWEFDAVARLAQAQMLGALGNNDRGEPGRLPESLERAKFIVPGPLWWAIRPGSAEKQSHLASRIESPNLVKQPKNEDLVLLIDEIDKADSNLPNGLLELLGNGDIGLPIRTTDDEKLRRPLTIITSNDERQLPPAFLRRCLVLTIKLPKPGEELVSHLTKFANAHIHSKVDEINKVPEIIVTKAAQLISKLREKTPEGERPPGAAEYLDLLRVVGGLGGSDKDMEENINDLHQIVLLKDSHGSN